MLCVVCGNRGQGKSVTGTAYAYKDFKIKHRLIYSNYSLKFKHEKIDLKKLEDLENATAIIDEAYLYADCRLSMSKINRAISYFAFQSRHTNVDVYWLSQYLFTLEKRINYSADKYQKCAAVLKTNNGFCLKCEDTNTIDLVFIKEFDKNYQRVKEFFFNPRPFFRLYNTKERFRYQSKEKKKNL